MSDKLTFLPRKGGARFFDSDDERIIADIVLAIPYLAESQYTTNNKPRVEDIEALLGEQITEAQRDEAMKALNMKPAKAEKIKPVTLGADDETN